MMCWSSVAVQRLSAAILLAKSGKKTHLICEQAVLGGLAAEVSSGDFRAPGVLHDSHRVRPQVVKALGLEQHGLSWRARPPLFGPELDGPGLLLPIEPNEMARAIGARGGEVGEGFTGYRGYLDRIRPALRAMMDNAAPSLQTEAALWPLLKSGLSLRRLGKRDMMELLRSLRAASMTGSQNILRILWSAPCWPDQRSQAPGWAPSPRRPPSASSLMTPSQARRLSVDQLVCVAR